MGLGLYAVLSDAFVSIRLPDTVKSVTAKHYDNDCTVGLLLLFAFCCARVFLCLLRQLVVRSLLGTSHTIIVILSYLLVSSSIKLDRFWQNLVEVSWISLT